MPRQGPKRTVLMALFRVVSQCSGACSVEK